MDEERKEIRPEDEEAPATEIPEAETDSPADEPDDAAEAEQLNQLPAGDEFAAHYNAVKQREIERLAREIEEKNSRDSKSKQRKWWIKTILMLVLIVVSVALMLTITNYLGDGLMPFKKMIQGISLPYLFVFIGVILLYMLLESAKYSYLLKISMGKWRLKNSIKTMYLGKYYDGITPLGTGGQPFQIYYLHKKNDIPAGVATAIPLVRYIVSTVVFCLIAIALFVITNVNGWLDMNLGGSWSNTVIMTVAIIALILNFLVPVMMVTVSLFPRFGKKFIVKLIGLLSKMRIVKHKYPTMKKYVYEANEYRNSMKLLFTKWWKLLPLIVLCILEVVVHLSMPFFAALAIAGPGVADNLPELWLHTCCLATISFYASSLIPTPGNSGASEAMTALVFLAVPHINNVLGWVILLWRFANYYLYILTGIGINIFEIIRSAVRNRRERKKNAA